MQFINLAKQQNFIREKIEMRIKNVLDRGKYIMGAEIFELEEKLADYVDVKHCITCSSGTDALLMSLISQGIGRGDAVITTPFTYDSAENKVISRGYFFRSGYIVIFLAFFIFLRGAILTTVSTNLSSF